MKNITFLFIFVVSTSSLMAQSLTEANQWFEKYEYAAAAKIYSDYAKSNELPMEDYKRWAYSYFVIGDYKKCLPLVDSILKTKDFSPTFYYIHAETSFAAGLYDQANDSYNKYQELDDEYMVANKIESCVYIPTKEKLKYVEHRAHPDNDARADFSGETWNSGQVFFKEFGKDSLGKFMSHANIKHSEVFAVHPFVKDAQGNNHRIIFPDSILHISVPSITLNETNNQVIFTVMRPIANKELDIIPHLYQGDYDAETYTVTNMKLWKYSGYEDSTSCAFASLNSDNDILVFSKMGKSTNGADLYYSEYQNGEWTKPKEYKELNTGLDEMYPLYNGDSILTFSSTGRPGYGNLDVYYTSVDGLKIGEIKHFSSPINSYGDDFNFHYYSVDSARYSSNKMGGIGDDDIYIIKFKEPKKDTVVEEEPIFAKNWVDQILYFDFDKFELKEQILNDLIDFISHTDEYQVVISGHADERGTVEYNLKLGQKRADEVKKEFIRLGIEKDKLITESKGKSDPQVDCSRGCSEEEYAKNRFVKIHLIKKIH